jgi:hypothetical protein
VIDEEDDNTQVLSNSNVQVNINQASSSSQVQDQHVSSTSSQSNANNQVQVLQPTNIARDHPSIEPKKIEEALNDIDWVNAMHEELNNFTRNQV